ncbi:MAG: hypothetical protein MRY83_11555 [Flavobacteriales bacterium]|nr:hypothetical protein [Flavobacteriales bacterium]
MKHLLSLFFLFFLVSDYMSQGIFRSNYWKQFRKEFYVLGGFSHFQGDVGYKPKNKFLPNLPTLSDYSKGVGYRYMIARKRLSIGALYRYTALSGMDLSSRGLAFRNITHEVGTRLETYILKGHPKSRYRIKGESKRSRFDLYLLFGLGLNYHDPLGKNVEGEWIGLQKIGTEGQYQNTSLNPYSKWTWNSTGGLGLAYHFGRFWKIGMECSYVYTGTDYLDDTGGPFVGTELTEEIEHFINPNKLDIETLPVRDVNAINDGYVLTNLIITTNNLNINLSIPMPTFRRKETTNPNLIDLRNQSDGIRDVIDDSQKDLPQNNPASKRQESPRDPLKRLMLPHNGKPYKK